MKAEGIRSRMRALGISVMWGAVGLLLFGQLQEAQAQLTPEFSVPTTNTTEGASWQESFSFPSGQYNSFDITIVRGEHIVPSNNVSYSSNSDTLWVELEPLANTAGRVVMDITSQEPFPSLATTTQTFRVAFLPLPPPPVDLTLDFLSPASTTIPGSPFAGSILFTPSDPSVWFELASISDETVVPASNVTFSVVASNEVVVTMLPLTNRSGSVSFAVLGEDTFSTSTVPYQVQFKTYPPEIATIADETILEDASLTMPVYITDADSGYSNLTVSVSMVSSTNPRLFTGTTNANFASGPGTLSVAMAPSGTNWILTAEPAANMNGEATIRVRVEDEVVSDSNVVTEDFVLTVTPVADRSVILGVNNKSFGDDALVTNVFAAGEADDVDHQMPGTEQLQLTVTLADDQILQLEDGSTSFSTNGTPATVTTALQELGVLPIRYRGAPGTINQADVEIEVEGVDDGLVTNKTLTMDVEVINTPPSFNVVSDPDTVTEGGPSVQPFYLPFVFDPDVGDDIFSLTISLADSSQSHLLSIGPATNFTDNVLGLTALIRGVVVQAPAVGMTNASEEVEIVFALEDGYGGVTVESLHLTVEQAQTNPQIFGIDDNTISKTDADPPFVLLPTVFVQDEDEGGEQFVEATLTQSSPSLGSFSQTTFPLQSPASLNLALRAVTYTPTPGVLAVGAQADSLVTLTVTDARGLSTPNSNQRIRITSVNSAPQIGFPPPINEQPVLLPPVDPLLPFEHVTLSNDDTNAVSFTISLDNPGKGDLVNLGIFTVTDPGVYEATGTATDLLASLTNLVFELDPDFLFAVDEPGGTTFTLEAQDFALLTTIRTLSIQVQDAPRNHLVTRLQYDEQAGSLQYALANIGNNDVITFALPEYPAVIRMSGSISTLVDRNVTIKGPGADLLRISGDSDGDGTPDRQLFRIKARVTMEGLTLADGVAGFGGAVSVSERGNLTLRNVAIVDSVAEQYGGAIDVDGGQLTLDGCYIGGNRLSEDTGLSGAGVSVYSDKDIVILNTTFGRNQQSNENGDGGGGLVVQNLTSGTPMFAQVKHVTFAENVDASGGASAILAVGAGTRIVPFNSVFQDFAGRSLDVPGSAEFRSSGGNFADDSTRTSVSQSGQSEAVFLLDHVNDRTSTNVLLGAPELSGNPTPFYPLGYGSPAINFGGGSTSEQDQRGVIREGIPDSGAIEFDAIGRLVINEIRFDDAAGVPYVELYVRRDSTPLDLASYSLYVDGTPVHDFADSTIISTNAIFPNVGDPVSTVVYPGVGMVVAFSDSAVSLTGDTNPTPVVRPSITGASFDWSVRGEVLVRRSPDVQPVARHAYLGRYLDPADGTNLLAMADNSISLAPQFLGYALIPHGYIADAPFSGMEPSKDPSISPSSPGADASGTPFGQDNAEPLARDDVFTVSEDDVSMLDILVNDLDRDHNDRVIVVDASTASDPGAGNAAVTPSALGAVVSVLPADTPLRGDMLQYDPRLAPDIQALPLGVEVVDTFHYEVIDIGFAPIAGYTADGGTTKVTSVTHRLETGDLIVISGSSVLSYNGTHAVEVVDDDTFTIPIAFAGNPAVPADRGTWETVVPRSPSSRSEALVAVRVIGANDVPVAQWDIITNVTERSVVRLMMRPERAGDTNLVFASDPEPVPDMLAQDLLSNDADPDSDDSWDTLRVTGLFGMVHAVASYSGTPGEQPVVVEATGHGLSNGDQMLISGYGGHPSYNGLHTITVVDADHVSIPVHYVDASVVKGVWVPYEAGNIGAIETDVEAHVALTLRADQTLDHLVYDANASAFLRTLAEGQRYTNRFWYAIEDRHAGVSLGPVDIIVEGVNDPPVANPDPDALQTLQPILTATSNGLDNVLADGLDLMYTLPSESGASNQTNLYVLDRSGTMSGTLVLPDFFVTDEDSRLDVDVSVLLANVKDIDALDSPDVVAVVGPSREQADISLAGGVVSYDPVASSNLQALTRDEMLIDTFQVVVSDGMPDGTVTSLVAVLVMGVNDTPTAYPVSYALHYTNAYTTHEDAVWALGLDAMLSRSHVQELDVNLVEPDDRLRLVPGLDVGNPAGASISIYDTNIVHDATTSELLNILALGQSFTNQFGYGITDNSFLFAVRDRFYLPAGSDSRVLDVLANDRDYTDAGGELTIVDAGPSFQAGQVQVAEDGSHLIYKAPDGFVGEDTFRYVIENAAGDRRSTLVQVLSVVPHRNGVLVAGNDTYRAAAGETVVLDVTANDRMVPFAGEQVEITQLLDTNIAGQPVLTNNTFVFTAGASSPLIFSYEIAVGGEARATADVVVQVVDRRGTLLVQDDYFSVQPGSFDNPLDVLHNDALVTESTANLRIRGILTAPDHGVLTTNATNTGLVYTPAADFVGTDTIRYLATDQEGGTGTGLVQIVVGELEPVQDFYTLEATNAVPIPLNVLANDRVLPQQRASSLRIVGVTPSTAPIGHMAVSGGTALVFTATGALGQQEFQYEVHDGTSTPRVASGSVFIESVGSGIYANPDVYSVRGNGENYALHVLTNDVSYPDVDKEYTISAVGSGGDGPDQGGMVRIENQQLVYTPAEGFFGVERFKYTMSDSVESDIAEVVVQVRRGHLEANDDDFVVFYALEDDTNTIARSFTLPVVLHDRIQPALGQVISIAAIGVGTNAPDQGGTVTIAPDGVTLQYRPALVPAPQYTERFTYEISDGAGRFAEGVVQVVVQNREAELIASTQDDAYQVARNSKNNLLSVLANDHILPGTAAGWRITDSTPSTEGGTTEVFENSAIQYTPPADFTGIDSFLYSVNDGVGGTGGAQVFVRVGRMSVLEDRFTVLSVVENEALDVLQNDVLFGAYADEYSLHSVFGATQGGHVQVSTNQQVLYTPDTGYAGSYPYQEVFFYRVPDDVGNMVTGRVSVVVHDAGSDRSTNTITLLVEGRNDVPTVINDALNTPITDKQTVTPFGEVVIGEVDRQYQERLQVTVSLDDAEKGTLRNLGSFTDLGDGSYVLTNVTAADAIAQIRPLVFEPVENRIPVPQTETTYFKIEVTDLTSTAVGDTNSFVDVTAVNDAPVVSGTQSNQAYYYRLPIQPFKSVIVAEVDNQTLQPLTVTVTMVGAEHGQLGQLGDFVAVSNGVFQAVDLTAAQATAQLQDLVFTVDSALVPFGGELLTQFHVAVDDGFALPVVATGTEVIAQHPFESVGQPATAPEQGAFGLSADVDDDIGIVGAPNASVAGDNAGVAFVYQRDPAATNQWSQWRQLLPATVASGHRFGRSVALDGERAAVGAVHAAGTGAVYLFGQDSGGTNAWGELLQVAATNLTTGGMFGHSVALDGDLLAVGAPLEDMHADGIPSGGVFLFGRNVGGTNAWGEIMRWAPDTAGRADADVGWSVALSGDTLMVGAPRYNVDGTPEREGAVFVLQRHTGGTNTWGVSEVLMADDPVLSREYGWSVSLDTDMLAVGAPTMEVDTVAEAGQVYLYAYDNGSTNHFDLVRTLDRAADEERRFGYSVSVDNARLMVGAPHNASDQNLGAAYLYERVGTNNTNWAMVEKFTRPTGSPAGLFGTVVRQQSGSGVIGAPANLEQLSNQGYAFFYRFDYNTTPDLTYSLLIDPLFRSHGSGSTTGQTIQVSSDVAWDATVPTNTHWITLTSGTSGVVDGIVTYSLSGNTDTDGRSGVITVAGGGIARTFTVNQAGTAAVLSLSPTDRTHGWQTVTGQIIAVTGNVDWTATSTNAWIDITSGDTGSDDGTVLYRVEENALTTARSGVISVTGGGISRLFTIHQDAAPAALNISPASRNHTSAAASNQAVDVTGNVPWTATSTVSWVTIETGDAGSHTGTVRYTVVENTAPSARTGTLSITGSGITRTFTVQQAAAPASLALLPESRLHATAATSGQTVDVTGNVSWTASESVAWITLTGGASGNGPGVVTYSIAENTGTERSSDIVVTGGGLTRIFSVHQAAAVPTLDLTPSNRVHGADAVSGQTVSVTGDVSWTATANASWLEVTDGTAGTGDGTVTYSVRTNLFTTPRSGTITVSGGGLARTFTVEQAGNSLAISLEHALDTAGMQWTGGGTANWFLQTQTTYDGQGAAQSGDITHNQQSWMETTITGPGTIGFWWKVSSDANWDFLRFYMNGAEQEKISGNIDWHYRSFAVPAGTNTFRWQYDKDASLSSGADAGWVDQIIWIPESVDVSPPTVMITWPTTAASWGAPDEVMHIGGTASDSVAVTSVTIVNTRDGVVRHAAGTTSWQYNHLPLYTGQNELTVTAYGAAGDFTTATLTVYYVDKPAPNDFDGDGVSDQAIFDTGGGFWYIKGVVGNVIAWANQWGWSTAVPVPGDYDGDGKADQAVFDTNGGFWYIKTLSGSVITWADQWGWTGALAVNGDYDGDGVSDQAIFDTNGGYWYIKNIAGNVIAWADQWGWSTAKPVPGDYDGDGNDDQAVFDTNGGFWYIKTVAGSVIAWADQWGWTGALAVPGDYDGDGISDQAIFDTNGGYWYIKRSTGEVITWADQWGWPTAIPVPGDYDGDGKYDLAVFDTATGDWYIKSVDGNVIVWADAWGWPGAFPVGKAK